MKKISRRAISCAALGIFLLLLISVEPQYFAPSNLSTSTTQNLQNVESDYDGAGATEMSIPAAQSDRHDLVKQDSLILRYTFDSNATLGVDSSGYGNNGNPAGNAEVIWDEERGNVLHLPGNTTDYVRIASDIVGGSGLKQVSFSFWIKIIEVPVYATYKYYGFLFRSDITADGFRIFYAYDEPGHYNGNLYAYPADGTGSSTAYSPLGQQGKGRWKFITVVYDSTTATTTYYVDGKLNYVRSLTVAPTITLGKATIGRWDDNYYPCNASLDDFRIYSTALSDDDVYNIYKGDDPAPWYDEGGAKEWQFRTNIEVFTDINTINYPIDQQINFTQLLHDMRLNGSLDYDSIQVVEWNDTTQTNTPLSVVKTQDPSYAADSNAVVNLAWTINDTTYRWGNYERATQWRANWYGVYAEFLNTYGLLGTWDKTDTEYQNLPTDSQFSIGQYYDQHMWFLDVDDYYISLSTIFDGADYNQGKWLESYFYLPRDIANLSMVAFESNEQIWVYIDKNPVIVDETSGTDRFIIKYLGPMSKGWHSVLVRSDNPNDYYQAFALGFADGDPYATTGNIDGMVCTASAFTKPRQYYVYFNITESTPTSYPNNEEYGSNYNGTIFPKILIHPPTYNGYKENLLKVSSVSWWDPEWDYRILVNFSASDLEVYDNYLVELNLDFTSLLAELGNTQPFDENSIRVVEYDEYFGTTTLIPSQFDKDRTFVAETNAIGTVSWVVLGKTTSSRDRFFFIYFDTTEYGTKEVADYSDASNLTLIDNGLGTDYTIENDKIRISLGLGDVGAGSSQDHIYEVYDKRSDLNLLGPQEHGWAILRWNYGGLDSGTGYFTEINDIEVVSNGPIKTTIRMGFENDYFIYNRYYTINYLDDSVKITHTVEAKQDLLAGTWEIANDWDNPTTTNFDCGIGGMDFLGDADTSIDSSPNFCLDDNVLIDTTSVVYPNVFDEPAWYTVWDEDRKVGVGTIWDPTSPTRYGGAAPTGSFNLKTIEFGTGARTNILTFMPPNLDIGESFSFNMWGLVYHGDNGLVAKQRASGFQTTPQLSKGDIEESNNAKLTLHLSDIDSYGVEGAFVQLTNATNTSIQFEKSSDANGNVTFKGLGDGEWDILVKYAVNGVRNYTIANTSYTINTIGGTVLKFYQNVACNLTTLNITVIDSEVSDPDNWALNNANVTLQNATNPENITSFYSDPEGHITMKLPATSWNFSVAFQGIPKTFGFDNESEANFAFTNMLNLSSYTEVYFNVSTNLYKTKLSVANYTWLNWTAANTTEEVNVYMRDSLRVALYFEAISGGVGVEGPIATNANASWFLYNANYEIINGSINMGEISEDGGGYYSWVLDTNDYMAGVYTLYFDFTVNDGLYQNATLILTINILNASTSLDLISPEENLEVKWSETMELYFHYYETYPVEDNNITNAQLYFMIKDKTDPVALTYWNDEPIPDMGIYKLTWNATLVPGIYTLVVFGNETNFEYQIISIGIQVLPKDTNFSVEIASNFRYTSTYLKVAHGETATFLVNYTATDGSYLGTDARITAILQGIEENNVLNVTNNEDGSYLISVVASLYPVGTYSIKISAAMDNHTSYTEFLDLSILDYWDTELTIIEPPIYYPWGNNASFIIKYSCVEDPRADWNLPGAQITQLNITYKIDTVEYTRIVLTEKDMASNLWGWEELGENSLYQDGGYYLVWFNTSVVNVSEKLSFYAIPTIQVGVYREARVRPYVWIAPVTTTLTPTVIGDEKSSALERIVLKLDESAEINAHINITEPTSSLLGKNLEGVDVTYVITDTETQEVLEQGTLSDEGAGNYQFTLRAYRLGEYVVVITGVLENHTTCTAQFTFIVEKKPITLTFKDNINGGIVKTPQNVEIDFSIEAFDTVHNEPLTGATIKLVKEDGTVWREYDPSVTDPDNDGVYVIHLSTADLEDLEGDTQFSVIFEKENYTMDGTYKLTIAIELPVDPYFGVPYVYWEIIGVSVGVMVAALVTARVIKNARIPLIIKQITKMKNDILKKRVLSDKPITVSAEQEIVEAVGDRWKFIGLDLETILGLQKRFEDKNYGPKDVPKGGL